MKMCTRCEKEKPLTDFYRNRKKKDGHFSWCKTCQYEQKPNPIKERRRREYKEGMRTCSSCDHTKMLGEYYTNPAWVRKDDPIGYTTVCKSCITPEKSNKDQTYIIQNSYTGDIKIGRSTNPEMRLKQLQVANSRELVLLRVIHGLCEGELQRRCIQWHLAGEWYSSEALLELREFFF